MASGRVAPPDPVGALVKPSDGARGRRRAKSREADRWWRSERERAHLDAVGQLPCLACGCDPGGTAAHVRMPLYEKGKPLPGTGLKPKNQWVLPLCHSCHVDQHTIGERSFWESFYVAPLTFAERLYRMSDNVEAMRALCWVALAGRNGGSDA
jgi:hypothetical protein